MTVNLFMINRTTSFILVLVMILNIIGASVGQSGFPDPQETQLRLKLLNKPALKSIESPDGDVIDCVSITQQPAFDNPLLKNHVIQMRPSSYIEHLFNGTDSEGITQLWRTNGECPENTVPIKRTTKEDLLRAEIYGKRYQNKSNYADDPSNHEYAIVKAEKGMYNGAKARINLWKPRIQDEKESSLSQIWLLGGIFGFDLNTLEAGWKVFADYYPRLFIFWTRDSYKNTGCYNHYCPGFVQINHAVALGASIKPISTYGGSQYEITLLIVKDPKTGNWWFGYGKIIIGYWPGSIVPNLENGATDVNWGGEIVNLKNNGKHTTTEMGSGHFADEKFGKASYFGNLGIVDTSNVLRDPKRLYVYVTNPNCYNVKIWLSKIWGTYFYYGGPGRNPRCP